MATFVHENFSEASAEPPGFLFVVCDEENGKAPKESKAVRKRHVMRTFTATRTNKAQSTADKRVDEERQTAGLVSCLAQTSRRKTLRTPYRESPTTSQPRSHATSVIPRALVPASPYESVNNVPSACNWVFYETRADGTIGFDVARYHFLEMHWHQARTHEVYVMLSYGLM